MTACKRQEGDKMTNYEKIKEMSLDEAAAFLCNAFFNKFEDCDKCPVEHLCKVGKDGFKTWLEQKTDA